MTRGQKIIIGVMVTLILLTFTAIFLALISLYRQYRAAQIAALPSPTTFPTVVYPATYTPTPTSPSAASGSSAGTSDNRLTATRTVQPRATIDPNNPVAVAFDAAMKKSQTAQQGRFTMEFKMQGDFGSDIPPGFVQDGKVTLLNLSGATKGNDTHMTFKGMLAAMFGADPVKGVEFMTVGGKSYLRGPMTFLGITDDKWYVASGASSFTPDNASPDQIFSGLEGNLEWDGITLAGTESLDELNCRVYIADKAATLGGIQTMGDAANQLPSNFDIENIQVAETKFWLCDDGYFHQMILNIQAQDNTNPSKTVSINAIVHLYDFDSNFEITPPQNATPLDMSKFGSLPITQTPP